MKSFFLFIVLSFSLFGNELININFKDLSIEELIKITSKKIGKSILSTEKIEGKIDFISNSAIKKNKLLDILKYSLKPKGYILIENDNIIRIVKETPSLNNDIKEKNVIKKVIKEKRVNEVVFLENSEAKKIEKILISLTSKNNYKKGLELLISANEELNLIILNGSKDEVNSLKSLIKKLDILKEQIFIKAMIVELDNNLIEDIGIKYGILGGKTYSGGIFTFSSSLNEGNAISVDTSSIGLSIPNVNQTIALGASLSLLNKTYGLDIISEPSILCTNNNESLIYVGEIVSIQTGTTVTDGGNTSTSYEREDIGLSLKVKPRVSQKEKIYLDITTLVENIKNQNSLSGNPDTSKKEIQTKAILNNGESVIIGGLIEKRNEKTIQKVPLAGDIPLIGELFKNRTENSQNKNLVVIITPYIVPKNKDFTFMREELSKLKSLEDQFLKKVLKRLREKQKKQNDVKEKVIEKNQFEKYFNI